jgi:tetrahydromethanopterin S-methyltransferase subunit G
MATETFKTLREVAIAIDGVKCVIEGVKSQLALMTLVFAVFAATSVTAFAYFFMVSVSNSTAIVRIETRLDGHDARFDEIGKRFDEIGKRFDSVDKRFEGVDARFDRIDRRLEQIVGILRPPKQQGQLDDRASSNSGEEARP